MSGATRHSFYPIPLDEWEETKNTIHLFIQIVGKIRLKTFPKMNQFWHVPLYVSSKGLTTRSIPYFNLSYEIEFDFKNHKIIISCSSGDTKEFSLENISAAEFYRKIFIALKQLGIEIKIWAVPYDIPSISTVPFYEDDKPRIYDKKYATKMWQILVSIDGVFQRFRSRFTGKSTPVHLFWHHFDLTVTRFSGHEAPPRSEGTVVDKEAYSHEVISFGFWFGDENVREPAFYAYCYPMPEGLLNEPLNPKSAFWNEQSGMALMFYKDVINSDEPEKQILDFFESVYQAGSKKSGWDIKAFELK